MSFFFVLFLFISHDWTTVVAAALNKYPNPLSPNVINCDVVDRTINPHGVIHSHRLLLVSCGIAPALTKIFNINEFGYGSEHSIIDARRRIMSVRTRNLSLNRFINIEERLEYIQHPTDSSKTLLKQEATINVENVPLTDFVEGLVVKTMNTNATTVIDEDDIYKYYSIVCVGSFSNGMGYQSYACRDINRVD